MESGKTLLREVTPEASQSSRSETASSDETNLAEQYSSGMRSFGKPGPFQIIETGGATEFAPRDSSTPKSALPDSNTGKNFAPHQVTQQQRDAQNEPFPSRRFASRDLTIGGAQKDAAPSINVATNPAANPAGSARGSGVSSTLRGSLAVQASSVETSRRSLIEEPLLTPSLPLTPVPNEAPRRRYSCNHYSTCLDLAAALNWDSFTCRGCCGEIDSQLLWRARQALRKDEIARQVCDLPGIELAACNQEPLVENPSETPTEAERAKNLKSREFRPLRIAKRSEGLPRRQE